MTTTFRRAPDFERRSDMIEATLDCIANIGIQATTVRAVAARAGVSNGLIRHHFSSKDNLIHAAYRRTVHMMLGPGLDVLRDNGLPPLDRMSRFVAASLGGPVADPRVMSIWATFISRVPGDPAFAEIHDEGYLGYRDAIETLIGEVLTDHGGIADGLRIRHLSTAIAAVLDGLWLEGCLAKDGYDEKGQIEIALTTIGTIMGVTLPQPSDNRS